MSGIGTTARSAVAPGLAARSAAVPSTAVPAGRGMLARSKPRLAAPSSMTHAADQRDDFCDESLRHFASLVESIGVKRFAQSLDLSTRQINRILAGAQPNPVERIIRSLQSSTPERGDAVLDFICQEMGGHFVRHEAINDATVNAVRECAEAIAAISDGQVTSVDLREIREAISALHGLILALNESRGGETQR